MAWKRRFQCLYAVSGPNQPMGQQQVDAPVCVLGPQAEGVFQTFSLLDKETRVLITSSESFKITLSFVKMWSRNVPSLTAEFTVLRTSRHLHYCSPHACGNLEVCCFQGSRHAYPFCQGSMCQTGLGKVAVKQHHSGTHPVTTSPGVPASLSNMINPLSADGCSRHKGNGHKITCTSE